MSLSKKVRNNGLFFNVAVNLNDHDMHFKSNDLIYQINLNLILSNFQTLKSSFAVLTFSTPDSMTKNL